MLLLDKQAGNIGLKPDVFLFKEGADRLHGFDQIFFFKDMASNCGPLKINAWAWLNKIRYC